MSNQQCNNMPKFTGMIIISNYMLKKYGLPGAIERMAKGKKLGRPARSLCLPPGEEQVKVIIPEYIINLNHVKP